MSSDPEDCFIVRCVDCRVEWNLDADPPACRCGDGTWVRIYKGDPNRVSVMCWDGRHQRCTGWIVVGSENPELDFLLSLRCECRTCDHPPVPNNRHLYEPPQGGEAWNSSTVIP